LRAAGNSYLAAIARLRGSVTRTYVSPGAPQGTVVEADYAAVGPRTAADYQALPRAVT